MQCLKLLMRGKNKWDFFFHGTVKDVKKYWTEEQENQNVEWVKQDQIVQIFSSPGLKICEASTLDAHWYNMYHHQSNQAQCCCNSWNLSFLQLPSLEWSPKTPFRVGLRFHTARRCLQGGKIGPRGGYNSSLTIQRHFGVNEEEEITPSSTLQ